MSISNYLKENYHQPREIWILAIMTFINRAGTMVVPFMSKYLRENLSFSYNEIGWIMLFFGVGSLCGTYISGKLSDKFGFYKVMVVSLFFSGLTFIFLQFISSFIGLCIGVFILTTIADMYRPAMLVSLFTYTNKENRTKALTLIRSAVNLGFLVGPAIGGMVIMNVGYNYIFYIDGITCIAAVLFFVYMIKERKLPFKMKNVEVGKLKNNILKDKTFVLHAVVTMITGILFFQMFTTLPLYHKEAFNLTEFESGLLLSLNGILIFGFELPIVNFIEKRKINELYVIITGVLAMVASFLVMIFFPMKEILIVMIVLMTLGVMLTFPFSNSFAMSRAYRSQEGKYMAYFTMSYSIAHIFSAKLGMGVVDSFGYNANWLIMGGLGIIGAGLKYYLILVVRKESEATKNQIINSIFAKKNPMPIEEKTETNTDSAFALNQKQVESLEYAN